MFTRNRRTPDETPPNCPKCGDNIMVTLDLRVSEMGTAGHFACPRCRITTHAFRARADRPRPGQVST